MSLLTIVQDAADEIGFPEPSTVIGNTDQIASQMLRLLNKEGDTLSRYAWEALKKEYTFDLVSSDQDYALPTDFRYIIPSSTWNRDNQRIIIEPLTSEEWQFFKGWTTVNGLNLRARIRNGQFEFEQTITPSDQGKTIAFEYISKYWAETETAQTGVTESIAKFTLDSDTTTLDEELLTQGLVWRFRKAKGLMFDVDLAEYQKLVREAKARDGGSRKVRLNSAIKHHLGVNTREGDYGS